MLEHQSFEITLGHGIAQIVMTTCYLQWFGNLVTPHWWDDLWLNEGFATYVEYIGVDRVRPDFMMVRIVCIYHLTHRERIKTPTILQTTFSYRFLARKLSYFDKFHGSLFSAQLTILKRYRISLALTGMKKITLNAIRNITGYRLD